MSLSSFCVVSNALRLNLFKLRDPRHDHKHAGRIKKTNTVTGEQMIKTLKITGMMCSHCEATVKEALEALDGVVSAEVSHESGTARVTLAGDISDRALKKAVEAKGYKVNGIE